MMEKYGKYWGRMLGDPLHMRAHADEFHSVLTPEEKECWEKEMGGRSIWSIFHDAREKKKEEKAKAKKAVADAKRLGIDASETDYFRDTLQNLREHGMTDEVAADGEEE